MAYYVTNKVAKGLVQDGGSGNTMNWWKANFNMPTPELWNGNWIVDRGPFTYTGEATSFNLSGLLAGFEVVVYVALFHWSGPLAGTAYINSQWRDENNNLMYTCANSSAVSLNIASGYWQEQAYACNQGIAGWEIDVAGNYKVRAWSTGTGAIGQTDTTITFSNVPSTTQLGSSTAGHIWVEGNNLVYICASRWKHTIYGTQVSTTPGTSKAGYIWIDTSHYIHWIGNNGYNYRTAWRIKQFASTFNNSATGSTFAGTGKAGCIWVDSEFGWTHLAYIGNDGYKYLAGAGDYPY